MADLIFTGELSTSKAGVKAKLELYSFMDEGVYIVYCPALDLSGYGYSIEEAKESFSEVFKQHVTYCINKNTLHEDLMKHGWNVRGKKSQDIKAPKLEDLLKRNETFREILNKDYAKFNTEIEFAS
jgi:ABC-type iron transport system FetAB ATPase subunit